MDEDEKRNTHSSGKYSASFYPKALVPAVHYQHKQKEDSLYKLSLLVKYDFSSELQRMSVVVRNTLDNSMICFVKGSPEKLYSLCDREKVPKDFMQEMDKYSSKGLRIIALAYRLLSEKEVENFDPQQPREDFENVSNISACFTLLSRHILILFL